MDKSDSGPTFCGSTDESCPAYDPSGDCPCGAVLPQEALCEPEGKKRGDMKSSAGSLRESVSSSALHIVAAATGPYTSWKAARVEAASFTSALPAEVSGAVAMSNTRFEITVTDPVKVSDGKLKAYMSYKVNKRVESIVNPVASVVRRYSDFAWLHDQLWKECSPGVIVPALPEKFWVGRFDEVRIEMRRRALQNFLLRIAAHPNLKSCQAFKAFLDGDADDLLRSKQNTAESFQKGLCTQATYAATSMISPFLKQMRVRDETDDKIDDMKQYICNFERDLNAVYRQTSCLIKRNKDLSNVLTKFGSGCEQLSKADGEDFDSMSKLAECATKLSASAVEAAHKETVYFEQPVGFYTQMIGPIQRAITVREEKAHEYERALKEFTSKKHLHAKVDGVDGKEEKATTAAVEVDQAQATLDDAKEVFYETTETLLKEFERFRQDKVNDFKKLVTDYTQLQMDFAAASQTACKEVLLADYATNFK